MPVTNFGLMNKMHLDRLSSTTRDLSARAAERSDQRGFTLIETAVALVIILVALLGVVFTFTYAINYNSGNNARAASLAVLQQQVELVRAAKFTPTITDPLVQGGTKADQDIATPNGMHFTVSITVDNDPFTPDIQDESTPTTLKEITITSRLSSPTPGWQFNIPTTVVLRRTRSN